MTDRPRSLGALRRLARKLPLPVRRTFVRWVDKRAAKREKPGRHHVGGAR